MFLKPKTTQLNEEAILYKRCIDITRYINASRVFRTLLSNATYKYWVYDTDRACMVEIENGNADTVINVSNDKAYYFNNNFWLWQNDTWKKIYANFNDIEIKDEFYFNYNNLVEEEHKTILAYFRNYADLVEKKAQIDADNNGTTIKQITLKISIGNVTISNSPYMLQIGYEKNLSTNLEMLSFKYYSALILNPPVISRYMYLNNNGNVMINFPNINLNISEYSGTLLDTPYDIFVEFNDNTDDYYDLELPNYEKIVALLFNDTGFRNVNLPIENNFVDKQQRSYFLNNGFFNYTYISDISKVEQQYIKGLNVEYKTFDIKTDSDMSFSEEDIIQIDEELYIINNIMYKTIRLPKPIKYTLFTCTLLKK